MRSNMLVEKGDTRYLLLFNLLLISFVDCRRCCRVPYNIISGMERPSLVQPDPIQKPSSLMNNQPVSARVDRRSSLQDR